MAIYKSLEFGGICCGGGGHIDIKVTSDDNGAEMAEVCGEGGEEFEWIVGRWTAVDGDKKDFCVSGGDLENDIFRFIIELRFRDGENFDGEVVAHIYTDVTAVHPLPICTVEIETV